MAHALIGLGIPFVFVTGCGKISLMPSAMDDVPIVRKSYDFTLLVTVLTSVMAKKGQGRR